MASLRLRVRVAEVSKALDKVTGGVRIDVSLEEVIVPQPSSLEGTFLPDPIALRMFAKRVPPQDEFPLGQEYYLDLTPVE